MLTVKQWDDFVRFSKARADKEMCNSVQLRESILHVLQQTSSDLRAQHTATAYGYRHRLHEYAMALDEMQYRKKLVSERLSQYTYHQYVSCVMCHVASNPLVTSAQCPYTFLANAFVVVTTVYCLLFFYSWCPPCQPFVKVGARAPIPYGVRATANTWHTSLFRSNRTS